MQILSVLVPNFFRGILCYSMDSVFVFQFDADGNGHITTKELGNVFQALGETIPGYKLRELIQQVDKDKNGMVEFEEFLEVKSYNFLFNF